MNVAPAAGSASGRDSLPGEIRIGISSWGSLPGFYPSGIRPAEKLPWYARFFSIVEVNVSFYRIVPSHTYDQWLETTPPDFTFDIKAFNELTHFRDTPPDATFAAFRDSYAVVRDAGRFGAALFQFPPRFTNTSANRAYLRRVAREMRGDIAVIEFRHHSWLGAESAPETLALLEQAGLAYAVVDEPTIPNDTVPLLPAVTNPALAYLRLHGRNAAAWYRGGSGGTRYDYDYSPAELEALASIVTDLASRAAQVHVLFNNNARGAGTVNAMALGHLLGVGPDEPPALPPSQPRLFNDTE
jgi:uncharacterized protein YecE (DUF72 family)